MWSIRHGKKRISSVGRENIANSVDLPRKTAHFINWDWRNRKFRQSGIEKSKSINPQRPPTPTSFKIQELLILPVFHLKNFKFCQSTVWTTANFVDRKRENLKFIQSNAKKISNFVGRKRKISYFVTWKRKQSWISSIEHGKITNFIHRSRKNCEFRLWSVKNTDANFFKTSGVLRALINILLHFFSPFKKIIKPTPPPLFMHRKIVSPFAEVYAKLTLANVKGLLYSK